MHQHDSIHIPGYDIKYEIGRGGMATVYLAIQRVLERKVAVKVLDETSDDSHLVQFFKREGRIIAQLSHPNIMTIYDGGFTEDHRLFLSIEYLEGGTLKNRIKRGLSINSIIEIIEAVAQALAYMHYEGVIHRDVKPSNILFRKNGTPVLTDFGIAKEFGSTAIHTKIGFAMGSPAYMSPEQLMGEKATIQSDLYSLGCVFYEMLTSHPLHESGKSVGELLKGSQNPVPELPDQYSDLQIIVDKLLARRSWDRYQSADDFLEDIDFFKINHFGIKNLEKGVKNTSILNLAGNKIENFFNKKKLFLSKKIFIFLFILFSIIIFNNDLIKEKKYAQEVALISEIKTDQIDHEKQSVAGLLKQADSQLKSGYLTTNEFGPKSAESSYRQVLKLNPGNAEALTGLQSITSEYEKRARQRFETGQVQESLEPIYQGWAVVPGHPGLEKIHQMVVRQQQADHYLSGALEAQRRGEYLSSLLQIEKGLVLVPGHQGLIRLRLEVRQDFNKGQQKPNGRVP